MRILHCTTSLDTGGAERVLVRLLSAMSPRFEHHVVSLTGPGVLSGELRARGIAVSSVQLKRRSPGLLLNLPRLASTMRDFRPDLIQGWMFHGSLAAQLAARVCPGRPPVLWTIRHSLHDLSADTPGTVRLIRYLAILSRRPACIIYNSARSARQFSEQLGYDASRAMVIPNGFDCDLFHPDSEARASVRSELGIAEKTPLIGLIARYHLVKDHATFLEAAARLPEAHFLLAGTGTNGPELAGRIRGLGLESRVSSLGPRMDIPRLAAALDVATCCSTAESFPNAIGEAMACAIPCVVTDVGEAPNLVGDTGLVVAPRSAAELAGAWGRILALPEAERRLLGEKARTRVLSNFSLPRVVSLYESLYEGGYRRPGGAGGVSPDGPMPVESKERTRS